MQVEGMEAVKHEDAYLRDQRFEFAASQLITLLYITYVILCCFNKTVTLRLEDILCLWNSV